MTAPRIIPSDLMLNYTMGGSIKVCEWFLDDSQADVSANYSNEVVEKYKRGIARGDFRPYGNTDAWLYLALARYPIEGKRVLIFGSDKPWYELIALEFLASEVVVSEYNDRSDFGCDVRYVKPHELGDEQFDVALSISSFEHDGLGRYGDPLNPQGDFLAMAQAKRNVVCGGFMFLAVPVGQDTLVWNAHRIYGQKRLPLLLAHWEMVASFGFSEKDYRRTFADLKKSSWHQPVFVLRNI